MNSNQTIETNSSIPSRQQSNNEEQNDLLKRLEQANERVRLSPRFIRSIDLFGTSDY